MDRTGYSPVGSRKDIDKRLAKEFLREVLKEYPRLVVEVEKLAEEEGFGHQTLSDARREEGIICEKRSDENGNWVTGKIWWFYPPSDAAEPTAN